MTTERPDTPRRPVRLMRTNHEQTVNASDDTRAFLIAEAVAAAARVPAVEILYGGGSPAAHRACQICIYLANVGLGWTFARAGRAFGRDRTTAAIACRAVEDLRDDPRVDGALDALESFVTADLFDGALA